MPRTFSGGVHPLHELHEGGNCHKGCTYPGVYGGPGPYPDGHALGAPQRACVKVGDYVRLGQMIGEPVGGLGLPVHASVSGVVTEVGTSEQLSGPNALCITIENDHRDAWTDLNGLGDVETANSALIVPAIKAAGICGMGGACFPTHIKLSVREGQYCDTIILNGSECETHLTADERLMLENPGLILDGLRAAMRAMADVVKRGVVAIEDNKPEAAELMRKAVQGREGIEIIQLKTKYPQGGEKQLIQSVTGREVPRKKLPLDVHVIVLNVGTAAAIADAVITGRPLIYRITTVTGCVKEPSNLRIRVGTSFRDAINACGGYREAPGKITAGGTMTGICASSDAVSATKATNGIVVYSMDEAKEIAESPCIRCGRLRGGLPRGACDRS